MRRLLAGLATSLSLLTATAGIANADNIDQPAGSVPIPDGPAPAWIIADMDTGQVLAGRDMYAAHPPASTIKTLLALTALDELPDLNATVVASNSDTLVECNCAGVRPGRVYTARQLLDGLLLVSGNDAANTLADMLGGYQAAVDKMNAKAVAIGGDQHPRDHTVGTGRSGWSGVDHPPARSGRDLPCGDGQSGVRTDHRAAGGDVPPGETGDRPLVNQDELLARYPGCDRR